MAYATADELAAALSTRVTVANEPVLDACLEAAAAEIDHSLDRIDALPAPVPAVVSRTNINRAVEWYKAPDSANGGVGFDQIGSVQVPASGFDRHAKVLQGALVDGASLKQQWGVG